MSIKEQIMNDIKTAMKARAQDKLDALRMVQSALKNKEIDIRPNELTDQDAMAVLKQIAKQRKDSIEQYTSAGRSDLADKEKAELAIIEAYLPAQLSKELLEKMVQEAIAETGAKDAKQMGIVMKAVLEKAKGQADNKVVSELVKAKLQS